MSRCGGASITARLCPCACTRVLFARVCVRVHACDSRRIVCVSSSPSLQTENFGVRVYVRACRTGERYDDVHADRGRSRLMWSSAAGEESSSCVCAG